MRNKLLAHPQVKAVEINEQRQTPSLIVLNDESFNKAQASPALANYLNLRTGIDNLTHVRQVNLNATMEVEEFQQTFKGIKVEHALFRALIKNGSVRFFNGAWFDVPANLSLQPAISENAALLFAKEAVGAKRYAWEEMQELIEKNTGNAIVKAALEKELAEYIPKGELVIVKNFTKPGVAELRLAYKFNIYAAEPISRAWIYIDAMDGKVLLVDNIIKHIGEDIPPASTNATVQTRYAGTQLIKTKQISGNDPNSGNLLVSSHPLSEPLFLPGGSTYVLVDDTRGNGIETYDLNGVGGLPYSVGAIYTQGKSFTDVDNNWTSAEHHRSPANDGAFETENDDIAFDAHWGAEVVYDYWLAKHNRSSYDGNNSKIKSFIHYGPAYDNAFWNGAAMTYGDGSGPTALGYKALTSLDVCGHEIGHGVCSTTSNLVYQGESGAMNEALSDIWAACIEHFAMVRSGSTVPSTAYRPFFVGEQIGATYDAPLRQMDNPKKQSNPDTYGGANWVNPICAPNLVNDQCGVHTNSGILNKWFFLLTAGSKNGTRPAGMTANQYYFTDSDDEINDLGNTYVVNGLGFDVAEQVTFLMETMLSASATYAEARQISIQVATSLSGNPCSGLVESVTNAWYAVGVGTKFVKPCTIKYGFVFQPGGAVNEASTPSGCTSEKTITVPVVLPANSTTMVTASGTGTAIADYVLSTTSLSNTTTTTVTQNVSVVIKNDAVIENDETIVLALTISNTGTNPVNNTYTITITDDDVLPVIGTTDKILLNEGFTRADGFADPQGWNETLEKLESDGDPLAIGKNQWGIFGNQLAITGKEGTTNTVFPNGTYNSNSNSQSIIRSPLLDGRGVGIPNIKFDYTVQGEVDVQSGSTDIEHLPVFDYMAVAYSLDGVHFVELNSGEFHQFAAVTPTSGTFTANLPASLSNKQFYIGFRWSNDDNAGGPISVSIDNLVIKGASVKIENDLSHNGRENLKPGDEVYFYSIQDRQLLGKVKNASIKDYGCTNLFVERTGIGAFNLYQGRDGLQKVSDKIVRIEPGIIVKGSTTVTVYYTESQLAGLELASGRSRTSFSIYQVTAAAYTAATTQNTNKYPAVYTAIPGIGGYYTISFNDKPNGSYALGVTVSILGLQEETPAFTITKPIYKLNEDEAVELKVGMLYPNPGTTNPYIVISSPVKDNFRIEMINPLGQVMYSQKEQIHRGTNKLMLNTGRISNGNYRMRITNEKNELVNVQQYLKQ
ncbi:MAG TPA: M4 family metallopeptidase [Ferruginibacter sp.]|nr:M4 family metallopeptidase [Ferruginibacter sp.]